MLELKGVYKSFHQTPVLKGIDLSVEKGDVVALLGPSGSGKTTLLRCMNFLEKADSGIMRFDGYEIDLGKVRHKDIHEVRLKTGFVFQNYNLFLNKTALENVMEGLVVARRIPKNQAKEKAMAALEKVGLVHRWNYYPSQLSGGQQQRVGIARAIATSPQVVFLDEPTSALDPELIDEVLSVIRSLAAEGTTMVIVTHEVSFAREVANKACFMDCGLVIEFGSAKEVLQSPKEERVRQFLRRILRDVEYYL